MIVEFTGLPGTGKTAVALALAKKGYKIRRGGKFSPATIWYNLLFFVTYPEHWWYIFKTVYFIFTMSPGWYLKRYKLLNNVLLLNEKYFLANSQAVYIFDQGYWHNVFSIFEKPVRRDILDRYIRLLPKVDLVFLFTASATVRLERLNKRGYGVRQHLPSLAVQAWQEAAMTNQQSLVELLKDGRQPYICMSTDTASINGIADKIVQQVEYARKS